MTRGFVIETNDAKHATAVAMLSSSAYPSYWGLNILEAYCDGSGMKGIIDDGGEPVEACYLSDFDACVSPRPRKACSHEAPEYVYVFNTETSELSVYDYGVLAMRGNVPNDTEKMKAFFIYYWFLDNALAIDPDSRKLSLNSLARMREAFAQYETGEALVAELKAGPKTCICNGKPNKLFLGCANLNGERDYLYRYTCYVLSENAEDDIPGPAWRPFFFELYPQWALDREGRRFTVGAVTPWGKTELHTPVRNYRYIYGCQVTDRTVSQRAAEKFIREFIIQNEENLVKAIPIFDMYGAVEHELAAMYKAGKSSRDISILIDRNKPVLKEKMEGIPEFIPGFTVQAMVEHWRHYIEARKDQEAMQAERATQAEKGGADA